MSSGRIVEIIGAVIDVEFNREDVPKVYDALTVNQNGLTLEVQQQLGDGIVRTIAMGVSDGLSRGLEVTNTGAPISIHILGSWSPYTPNGTFRDFSARLEIILAFAATLLCLYMFLSTNSFSF